VLVSPKVWHPIALFDRVEETNNQPLLMRCEDDEGRTATAFVKALGCPYVTDESLFAEVVGCLLARELGILVPDVIVVELDEPSARHFSAKLPFRLRPCSAAGSIQLLNTTPVPKEGQIEDASDAAKIMAFDVTFRNSDRLPDNPNLFAAKGRIVAYDFSRSFEFISRPGEHPPPVAPHEAWIARKHIFAERLRKARGAEEGLDAFLASLAPIAPSSLQSVNWFPRWGLFSAQLATWLEQIAEGRETFERNLKRAVWGEP
jgi:hypothetical protein